jgi:hypothetical protein
MGSDKSIQVLTLFSGTSQPEGPSHSGCSRPVQTYVGVLYGIWSESRPDLFSRMLISPMISSRLIRRASKPPVRSISLIGTALSDMRSQNSIARSSAISLSSLSLCTRSSPYCLQPENQFRGGKRFPDELKCLRILATEWTLVGVTRHEKHFQAGMHADCDPNQFTRPEPRCHHVTQQNVDWIGMLRANPKRLIAILSHQDLIPTLPQSRPSISRIAISSSTTRIVSIDCHLSLPQGMSPRFDLAPEA